MPKVAVCRDPERLVVPPRGPATKLILGLDLGTSTGYTFSHFDKDSNPVGAIFPWHMGQWDLSAGPYDSGAIRFVRLRQFLSTLKPDMVFYEDVKNNPPKISSFTPAAAIARVATASELIGAFRATVCTWAEEFGIPCTGFGIGTIKKRATGKGNANKEDVIAACNEMFGATLEAEGYESSGVDNIADSSFVLLLGLEQYGRGIVWETENAEQQV